MSSHWVVWTSVDSCLNSLSSYLIYRNYTAGGPWSPPVALGSSENNIWVYVLQLVFGGGVLDGPGNCRHARPSGIWARSCTSMPSSLSTPPFSEGGTPHLVQALCFSCEGSPLLVHSWRIRFLTPPPFPHNVWAWVVHGVPSFSPQKMTGFHNTLAPKQSRVPAGVPCVISCGIIFPPFNS